MNKFNYLLIPILGICISPLLYAQPAVSIAGEGALPGVRVNQVVSDTGVKGEPARPGDLGLAGPGAAGGLRGSGEQAPQDSVEKISLPCAAFRQSTGDAWWTGPILAAGAGTMPKGHLLIEPYLYDVTSPHTNSFGSFTYIVYGLTNRLSIGMIPTAGYTRTSQGKSSSGIGPGDMSLMAQYRLTTFHPGGWVPTLSINVEETFPTGRYDRLGDRPNDGFGSGAYTTTVSLYTQELFWLPNGRILRMRLDLSRAFSTRVNVTDASVYGTGEGFRGHAIPGSPVTVDLAGEYSLTRRWVLALDINYRYNSNTQTTGYMMTIPPTGSGNAQPPGSGNVQPPAIQLNSGYSVAFAFAPAIEYNMTSNLGFLLGSRLMPSAHNTSSSITPVLAVNMYF